METFEIDFLGNLKFLLPQSIIFAISVYYFIRKRSIDGVLLVIGSGLSLCILFYHLFILPYGSFNWWLDEMISLNSLLSIISLMSSLAFVAGFLMLIVNRIEQSKQTIENDITKIK